MLIFKPSRKLRRYFYSLTTILSAALFISCLLLLKKNSLILLIAAIISILIPLVCNFIILPIFWRKTSYSINKNLLKINTGIYLTKEKFIRTDRMVQIIKIKLPFSSEKLTLLKTIGGNILVFAELAEDIITDKK